MSVWCFLAACFKGVCVMRRSACLSCTLPPPGGRMIERNTGAVWGSGHSVISLFVLMQASLQFGCLIQCMMSNTTHKPAYRHKNHSKQHSGMTISLVFLHPIDQQYQSKRSRVQTQIYLLKPTATSDYWQTVFPCFHFASNLAWHQCLYLYLRIKQQKAEQPPDTTTGAQCAVR